MLMDSVDFKIEEREQEKEKRGERKENEFEERGKDGSRKEKKINDRKKGQNRKERRQRRPLIT